MRLLLVVACLLLSRQLLAFIYVWHELDTSILGGGKKSLTLSSTAFTFSVKPLLFSHRKGSILLPTFCCFKQEDPGCIQESAAEHRLQLTLCAKHLCALAFGALFGEQGERDVIWQRGFAPSVLVLLKAHEQTTETLPNPSSCTIEGN